MTRSGAIGCRPEDGANLVCESETKGTRLESFTPMAKAPSLARPLGAKR